MTVAGSCHGRPFLIWCSQSFIEMEDFMTQDDFPHSGKPRAVCRLCGKSLAGYNTSGECFHHVRQSKDPTPWLLSIMREAKAELSQSEPFQTLTDTSLTNDGQGDITLSDALFVKIVSIIAKETHVKVDDILGRRRVPAIAEARQILMYLLREMGLSFPEIGTLCERDHTTVMHACDQIAEKERQASDFRALLESICDQIRPILDEAPRE